NDFYDLTDVENRLMAFQDLYSAAARPFTWKYTTKELNALLVRIAAHEQDPHLVAAASQERAQVDQAVATVRGHRRTVLGMPRVRHHCPTYARSVPHDQQTHDRRPPRRLRTPPPTRHQSHSRRHHQRRGGQRLGDRPPRW